MITLTYNSQVFTSRIRERTCFIGFRTIEQANNVRSHIITNQEPVIHFLQQEYTSTFRAPEEPEEVKVSLIKSPVFEITKLIVLNNFMFFVADDVDFDDDIITLNGILCDMEHEPSTEYLNDLFIRSTEH